MVKTLLELQATRDYGSLLITAEVKNKVAYLSIEGYIHPWADASSKNLKNEIKKLKSEGATEAELYLNTEGGVCFQANEMVNILKENFGNNIPLKIGALAASSGSFIVAVFNKTASAYKNSKFMVHKPQGGFRGTAAQVKKSLKSLQDLEDDYKREYARAFNKTEDEIEEMWKDGDHWMTADEALEEGLISSIIEEEAEITPAAHLQLVAAGAPGVTKEPEPTPEPKKKNQNSNTTTMDKKVLAVKLGLPEDATEAQINAALDKQREQANTAATLQAKLDGQSKEAKEAKIKALLDKGEKEKKFTGDMRAHYQAFAEANYEGAEKAIEALEPVAKIDTKKDPKNPGGESTKDALESYQAYLDAENGDALWATLEEENPELAEKLITAHYNKEN
tara:strand:- start:1057 stop:2235 length:1179 start_codon:yes stop_codon:yes gene_type:complete